MKPKNFLTHPHQEPLESSRYSFVPSEFFLEDTLEQAARIEQCALIYCDQFYLRKKNTSSWRRMRFGLKDGERMRVLVEQTHFETHGRTNERTNGRTRDAVGVLPFPRQSNVSRMGHSCDGKRKTPKQSMQRASESVLCGWPGFGPGQASEPKLTVP